MRRLSLVAVLFAVVSVACGDSDSPTSPSSSPTSARFTVRLLPANEVPPVTNADASASGTTTITLNLTRDAAGTITAATADFQTTVTGFPASTTATGGHIHRAPAGSNAGVLVGQFGSGEFALTNGAGSLAKNGISVGATDAQGILDNPSGHYFNFHTTLNPGGAIRGQLSRTQ
ncbi:MAG: CHRD domain-containing protein [Acidobacteria bacterium]|nr:CHRD domain-containing protein [Acidobacteriota bacterium]